MPEISVDHLGQIGIVKDLASYRLQPNAWTDGQNVHFDDDKVRRILGSETIWSGLGIAPWHLLFQRTEDELFWIAAGEQRIKAWNGAVWTDISRGTLYNASSKLKWNGGIFGGIAILNNGIDVPQFWASPDVSVNFTDLTNWPSGVTARVLRPFGSFLIAGNITKSGTTYEHMIKWSHRADPGSVPDSWDHTDATKDAGETNLIDTTAGPILDMAQLGSSMFVYKANAIHEMTPTRDFNIFNIKSTPFHGTGVISTNCVTQVPRGNRLFLATGDDLVLHNGQEMQSLIDRRWRNWLVNNMAFEAAEAAFVIPNLFHNEMWFCFPETSEVWCTKALVWNYTDNSIGIRELDQISFGAPGIIIVESDSWDTASGTWDSDSAVWNNLSFDPQKMSPLLADPLNTRVLHGAKGNLIGDANINASVERKALAIVGKNLQGNLIADPSTVKIAQRIWIKGSGGPFDVQLGAHDEEDGTVTWDTAASFDPTTDQYVDPETPPNGRYLAVKFSSSSGEQWQVEGYKLEFDVLGEA